MPLFPPSIAIALHTESNRQAGVTQAGTPRARFERSRVRARFGLLRRRPASRVTVSTVRFGDGPAGGA